MSFVAQLSLCVLAAALTVVPTSARAQGTFVYDQQSSTEGAPSGGIVGINPLQQLVGQSFVPSLSAVGFVRLQLYDVDIFSGVGATIVVNLRSNGVAGPVLAASLPVSLPNGFNGGFQDFFFANPVVVTPGDTYVIQPNIQSGDAWAVGAGMPASYPSGTAFFQGLPVANSDLWFREGIYVPEPSVLALIGLTISCFIVRRKKAGL
jgi:hypothetical protein